MSSNSSGKKLEGFLTGKGFYIVLFLCAAVIGVSAWMMAAGNETMDKEQSSSSGLENARIETVVIPPVKAEADKELESVQAPEVNTDGLAALEPAQTQTDDAVEAAAPLYIWPLEGELERSFSDDELEYDVTMRDWRTHSGIDILAPVGSTVLAAHSGLVESIINDDLYGTVVTISHGDGGRTVYANLADTPSVTVGTWIEPGTVIGSVGETALCEVGQGGHLHFAITVDGECVNPMYYLPA